MKYDYIRRLERRRNYLETLIADKNRTDWSYTITEKKALDFAIASMKFVKDGFYDAITDNELNLTTEQIEHLSTIKAVMVRENMGLRVDKRNLR